MFSLKQGFPNRKQQRAALRNTTKYNDIKIKNYTSSQSQFQKMLTLGLYKPHMGKRALKSLYFN